MFVQSTVLALSLAGVFAGAIVVAEIRLEKGEQPTELQLVLTLILFLPAVLPQEAKKIRIRRVQRKANLNLRGEGRKYFSIL